MTITQIDRNNLKAMQAKMLLALGQVAEEFGVTLANGGGTFSADKATVKFVITIAGGDPHAEFRRDFERYYTHIDGLQTSDLGRTFVVAGIEYELIGAKVSARKMPLIGRSARNGKLYKFTTNVVGEALRPELAARRPGLSLREIAERESAAQRR